jgi:hypothetical protein
VRRSIQTLDKDAGSRQDPEGGGGGTPAQKQPWSSVTSPPATQIAWK